VAVADPEKRLGSSISKINLKVSDIVTVVTAEKLSLPHIISAIVVTTRRRQRET
jgi:hypothetical protein